MSYKIIHVVGARPNFMKVTPVFNAMAKHPVLEQVLVHTGQHYDANMSEIFFRQLGIPEPDMNLEVGSGSQAVQVAQTILKFEEVVLAQKPDMVMVYGDVNSTLAASLVCSKLQIPVSHVEAGLRSGDMTMPEEINRILTDQLASLLFTPSVDGNEHLAACGLGLEKIHLVGNVMIDTLVRLLPKAELPTSLTLPQSFALITLHRPSNVDHPEQLLSLMNTLGELSEEIPMIFPVHPRTRAKLADLNFPLDRFPNLQLAEPMGYLQFLALQRDAAMVITDSGGIQEETTYLGVPCLTVRENTERPITMTHGTNRLIGVDAAVLAREVRNLLAGDKPAGEIPILWDGKAGERIARIVVDWLEARAADDAAD